MNKNRAVIIFSMLSLLLFGCSDAENDKKSVGDSKEPVNAVMGDWRTGHAVYTLNDSELKFRHYDEKSGVEDYGFNGVVISKTQEGEYVRIVAYVTELTTTATWSTGEVEGYVTLFGVNIIDGVNADFVRIGTPGFSKDPMIATQADALEEEIPDIGEGSKWRTYDPEPEPAGGNYLFDDIQGSWRSGHAEYHINGNELVFRHFDNESGVEDFGFIMTIKAVTQNSDDLSMVASVDSITTSADWMTGSLEGYVNLFATDIINGTNVTMVRKGTPGYTKDPLLETIETAKTVAKPATGKESRWLVYDIK